MKKRLLFVTLIISVLFVTACGSSTKKTEKMTYNDSSLKLTTTFSYGKEDGFKFEKNISGGRFAEIEFSNEKQNIYFDMYYVQSTATTSKYQKDNKKNDTYFKEFKFGDYEAYTYGFDEDKLYLMIELKNEDDTVTSLFVAMDKINSDKSVVFDTFKKDVLQEFFKSIKITEE